MQSATPKIKEERTLIHKPSCQTANCFVCVWGGVG